MAGSRVKVWAVSLSSVLLLCVLHSEAQQDYSGQHSGDEHTYEGSLVDGHDEQSGYPKPVVTMITEESYPYATTSETYDYAKEVTTLTTEVPYGEASLGEEEGPTECDCEPGEPGFAGFAGPKVGHLHDISHIPKNVEGQLF
ncbi:hypothetical protein SRHO_G00057270 [Serrasalmus rhombeus]